VISLIDEYLSPERLQEHIIRAELEPALMLRNETDIDPIARLLDEKFTERFWEYEHSQIGDVIPGELHVKQLEALHEDVRHRFLFWGNQVGKTTLGAVECDLVALKRHPTIKPQGPAVVWASALTWELWEQILLPELLTWLPQDRIISAPEPFRSTPGRRTILVRADDGSVARIVGKSVQQGRRSYQSAKVHFVWLDEEHPEQVWDEIQPRLLRFGGRTLTTATPLLGLTWLFHRVYESWRRGTEPEFWCSHAGLMDNPAIDAEMVAATRRQFAHDPSQLAARLDGKFARPTGLALSAYDPKKNLESFGLADAEEANRAGRTGRGWTHVCGLDFSYWRFAFLHGMVDHAGRLHIVKEYFSQKQTLEVRARHVHEHLAAWGAPEETRIWSDCANPTDINELNAALKRIGSPYRCRAVKAESKARRTGVTLLNDLFARGALLISRTVDDESVWYRGQDASSDGQPAAGSRLLYEIGQWRYEKPTQDGKVQSDDPVDDTADGADCCAALRYLAMSHFRPAKKAPVPPKRKNPNLDDGYAKMQKAMRERMKREQVA